MGILFNPTPLIDIPLAASVVHNNQFISTKSPLSEAGNACENTTVYHGKDAFMLIINSDVQEKCIYADH